MKYFCLAAVAAAGVSAWSVEPKGNYTTWGGQEGQLEETFETTDEETGQAVTQTKPAVEGSASGAALMFDIGGNIGNGAGSCSVSSASPLSAINIPGFNVDFAMSPSNGPWNIFQLGDQSSNDLQVLVTGEVGGAQFDADDISISCSEEALTEGDMKMGSFPYHNEAYVAGTTRNGKISLLQNENRTTTWGQFVMSWPNPLNNITFNNPNVHVDHVEGQYEATVTADEVSSADLWFSYDAELAGSYEISIVGL
jgi:hypothetical protein